MPHKFKITAIDTNKEVIDAYLHSLKFEDMELQKRWSFIIDDIIKYEADAFVSPANSEGLMNGGIDKDYLTIFGNELEERVTSFIREDYNGLMPIGQAMVVPTYHPKIPYLIVAPTMVKPSIIEDHNDIYKAAKAIFNTIDKFNKTIKKEKPSDPLIKHVMMPGLGTGTGELEPEKSALMVKKAFLDYLKEKENPFKKFNNNYIL